MKKEETNNGPARLEMPVAQTEPMSSRKIDVARRQLGTALQLYLWNLDPVSVHVLACGGAEIDRALAGKSLRQTFSQMALVTHPQLKEPELHRLLGERWNAMKHFNYRNGKERDDEDLLALPLEAENEARLGIGWHDYTQTGLSLPIEVQVFNLWFFAKHGEVADLDWSNKLFPALQSLQPNDQKDMLRSRIESNRRIKEVMESELTDPRPLILSEKS